MKSWFTFNIPYWLFRKKFSGDYVDGVGFVVKFSREAFVNFFYKNINLFEKIPNKLKIFIQKLKYKIKGDKTH